jgi:hypothetical protein
MKLSSLMLAGGLLLGSTAALAADDAATLTMAKGEVVSADAQTKVIVVKVETTPGQTDNVSFMIGPETKIIKGTKNVQFSEVLGGDKVTVNYKTVAGKKMAVSIGIDGQA